MKFITLTFLLLASVIVGTAQNTISLHGQVKAAITKRDLTNAYILLYDAEGNVKDSIQANKGFAWRDRQIDTLSYFFFTVPRVDSIYVFDVICEGYEPKTVSFTVEKIGKRETYREIPLIYLNRAAIQLNEVTVTSSKIKFYNKGDTVVYDANAFQLAEGSMLDALIAQLPGVELTNDGQIKVNGEYVESLLLDGKNFLDGNKNLMLENIAAYTVKNIQVYEGVSRKDEAEGKLYNKVLTMDVRLKKEYNIGWFINAQGGYGTSNRYMGRLFASWFNPLWKVALVGNINNLNDNRKPGRNDTWTPEEMPSGRQRSSIVGLNYNYDNPDTKSSAEGSITFQSTNSDTEVKTDRTNFLQGGNTYDKTFGNSYNKSTSISTYHWMNMRKNNFGYGGSLSGSYMNSRNSSSNLSGTFNENQDSITWATLDAIYSVGKEDLLETIINRSKTQTDGWTKNISAAISPNFNYRIPKSSDSFNMSFGLSYSSVKNELWKDYEINYGQFANDTEKLRQYFDNTPNHNLSLRTSFSYVTRFFNALTLYLSYHYTFSENIKDSYMYALDRLNDMGIYGTLPSGYLSVFDPNNSYKSKLLTNSHSINPSLYFDKKLSSDAELGIAFTPDIQLYHRNLNYWRNEQDYRLSKSNTTFTLAGWWSSRFYLSFRKRGEDRNQKYTNSLMYSFIVNPQLPDMFDMVDVINDSDPLNIYIGNPDLKQQIYHRHHFRWNWMPYSHSLDNIVYFNYSYTMNALTRGYTYDTTTGIRYNKMYNVGGNHSYQFTNELKWQFGRTKQFTLDSYSEIDFSQYSDMIGVNMEEPVLSKVHNRRITENFKLGWQIGKVNLGIRCDLSNRYTTSTQEGFNTLNATHLTSGFTGLFKLPAGFEINTDFMCYTRNGYGVDYLDTTDPVWNIRFSYCPPRNTKWVIMLDGYDMLHTLSNVSYAVTASGRTISYTNVLPRYLLLTVQYRLNIQPKKK